MEIVGIRQVTAQLPTAAALLHGIGRTTQVVHIQIIFLKMKQLFYGGCNLYARHYSVFLLLSNCNDWIRFITFMDLMPFLTIRMRTQ